jgi:hypothetical protein
MCHETKVTENIAHLRSLHVRRSIDEWPAARRAWYKISRHFGTGNQVRVAYSDSGYCEYCGYDTPWPCQVVETLDFVEDKGDD